MPAIEDERIWTQPHSKEEFWEGPGANVSQPRQLNLREDKNSQFRRRKLGWNACLREKERCVTSQSWNWASSVSLQSFVTDLLDWDVDQSSTGIWMEDVYRFLSCTLGRWPPKADPTYTTAIIPEEGYSQSVGHFRDQFPGLFCSFLEAASPEITKP